MKSIIAESLGHLAFGITPSGEYRAIARLLMKLFPTITQMKTDYLAKKLRSNIVSFAKCSSFSRFVAVFRSVSLCKPPEQEHRAKKDGQH